MVIPDEHSDQRLAVRDLAAIRIIYSPHAAPKTVFRDPNSPDNDPVFVCKSEEDLKWCIDNHFFRAMGIINPST
jgi:hypothetical protein